MTTPKDWRARVRTKLITPPGSIPSIEENRPVIQPPKLNYPPLGPIAGGSPGKGPGFALTDHQHPPQSIPAGSTAATSHRATWDLPTSFSATPGTQVVLTGSAIDNPSGLYDPATGVFTPDVRGLYLVTFASQVELGGTPGNYIFGIFNPTASPPIGDGIISGSYSGQDGLGHNNIFFLKTTAVTILDVGQSISFVLENSTFSPDVVVTSDTLIPVLHQASVVLLGTT